MEYKKELAIRMKKMLKVDQSEWEGRAIK